MINILATLLNKRYIVTAMHCIKSGTEVAKSVEVKVIQQKLLKGESQNFLDLVLV